jgi:hypothetical protein
MQQRDCEIAALRTELSQHLRMQESSPEAFLGHLSRLEADVSAMVTASALSLSTPRSGSAQQTLLLRRTGIL